MQEKYVQTAYDKLTRGFEELEPKSCVDAFLNGAQMLKKSVDELIEMFYDRAESHQANVIGLSAQSYKERAAQVIEATKSGDLAKMDEALHLSIEASLKCRESTAKMRYIRNRGVEPFQAQKEIGAYVRELETRLTK